MRLHIFLSDVLPPTTNDIIDVARRNKFASAKAKDDWTTALCVAFERAHAKMFDAPVYVEYVWRVKNFARDEDNTTGAQKYINDGLVKAGVVKDDNLKVIVSPVTHWFRQSPTDGFVLFVYDEQAWRKRLRDRAAHIISTGEDLPPLVTDPQIASWANATNLSIEVPAARKRRAPARKVARKRAPRK
jgi:hypothetical protein